MIFQAFAVATALAASCPPGMVAFETFCMDRYEAPNEPGASPVTAWTAQEGERWCNERGKRLCNETEWLRACRGKAAQRFPYGEVYRKGICNDDKEWRSPNWKLVSLFPAPDGRAEVERLYQGDPSGSRQGCVSDEGVYDLTGNVAEWVVRTRPHPISGRPNYDHVMKGCYWVGCYKNSEPDCFYANRAHPGHFRSYETGFRCCGALE